MIISNIFFCNECGKNQSQFDHAFYHCHDCGECVIFNPQEANTARGSNPELQCVLCCKCVDSQVLKSHPGWVRERVEECRDPYAFIDKINFSKELFGFIKARVDPNAKAVPKRGYYQNRRANSKLKASVIICPIPKCNYRCVEHQEPVADLFLRHLKKVHHITPRAEFVENLKGKISYLRNNDRISYIDPFVHVQREGLLFSLGD